MPPDALRDVREPKPFLPETVVLCFLAGIVGPLYGFGVATYWTPLRPEWQSGELKAFAGLLFEKEIFRAFLPFMFYSMISMGLAAANLPGYGGNFFVRFGLATGVVQVAQWAVALLVCLNASSFPLLNPLSMGLCALVPLALFGIWLGVRRWLGWRLALLYSIAAVGALVLLAAYLSPDIADVSGSNIGIGALLSSLFCAPPLAFTVYLLTLWSAWRRVPATPAPARLKAIVVGGWTASYAAAWYHAVLTVAEKYSELPSNPPHHCYVATAASRGHRRLVGTRPVLCADGTLQPMNAQTRTLKCAELMLREACPRLHRPLRRAYDAVGPVLARRITHPLLADAAYLALKPAEWAARCVVRAFGRG